MNACVICGEHYPDFLIYDMHMKMRHSMTNVTVEEHPARKRMMTERREYRPMDRLEKARIVAQGEARLGLKHFLGGK